MPLCFWLFHRLPPKRKYRLVDYVNNTLPMVYKGAGFHPHTTAVLMFNIIGIIRVYMLLVYVIRNTDLRQSVYKLLIYWFITSVKSLPKCFRPFY